MYLLLRDNKQTGPYSLDEITAKGLKAYDLVWVEGRSAAWRYPSEVGELSAFAPAVEEQPFDRFYKRAAVQPAGPETDRQMSPAVAVMSEASPKRTIYVTMPGGVSVREAKRETSAVRETVTSVREVILPPLARKKPNRLWQAAAVGFCVLLLLAAGIFIGLSIQKDGSGSFKLASGTSEVKDRQPLRTSAKQLPMSPVSNAAQHTNAPVVNDSSRVPSSSAIPVREIPVKSISKPRITVSKQKTDAAKSAAAAPGLAADSAVSHQAVFHRESEHRSDVAENHPAEDKESLRMALANQVAVGANKYATGTFGGISNLQVTVSNRSAYSLDLVVVAVSYIQANKKIYKTENLYFRGIGPGSALMLEAPKSSRGVNIQYKVTSISSKELGLSEPGT